MGSSWQNFSSITPPERGAFPLDFYGQCNNLVKEYLECLQENKQDANKCKPAAKKYFQCRMQKGLMEKEEFIHLGFRES
jgi:cytochrome c oxidase assembly protein subunit 19